METEHSELERRSWAVSLLVSVLTVSFITASSFDLLPQYLVPDVPDWFLRAVPHINAVLVLTGLVTVLLGYRAVRGRELRSHARYMVTASAVFFSFLVLYLLRLANMGVTEFPGSDAVYNYVYLPFLFSHIALAIVCVPLVLYAVFVATSLDISEVGTTSHPRVGRIAVPLWAVSFASGFVVYLMLHHVF